MGKERGETFLDKDKVRRLGGCLSTASSSAMGMGDHVFGAFPEDVIRATRHGIELVRELAPEINEEAAAEWFRSYSVGAQFWRDRGILRETSGGGLSNEQRLLVEKFERAYHEVRKVIEEENREQWSKLPIRSRRK